MNTQKRIIAYRRPAIAVAVASLVIATAAAIGMPSALAAHRHHEQAGALPSIGREPKPSIFGINATVHDSSHANFVRDIPAARALGARWDRVILGPTTGTGDFAGSDFEVKQAREQGMGVLLALGGIPGACSQPSANAHSCPPSTPAELRSYQEYMRRVILRYRHVVSYYESWIEPNASANWLTGPNATAYAALLTAQYEEVQAVNRQYDLHVKLLFGSPIGFTTGPWTPVLTFTNDVLNVLHGARPFDGIALLAYRFPPYGPDATTNDVIGGSGEVPAGCNASSPSCQLTWSQELTAYEQEFLQHGYGQQPLWITEFGWGGNAQPDDPYYPSYTEQAEYLREAYQDLLALPFVQAAFWFNSRDYQPGVLDGDPAWLAHYGLRNYDFSEKPAAAAFKLLADANPGR